MTEQLPAAQIRTAVCKDCMRRPDITSEDAAFTYPDAAFERMLSRGGSRSDRCPLCRRRHRMATSAFAVTFVDVETVGSVENPVDPSGPLGGLGRLPKSHDLRSEPVTEPRTKFGMSDKDIRTIVERLGPKQVAVVKAGTGTGKSTFMPFRLAFPPEGTAKLTNNGPIVVTEPRIQATVGVATYVATKLCRTSVGPGGVVGYQADGTAAHDASNQLIYATDGSAVNWLSQRRHANWGVVIIDEAHERSANIDLILAILKRDLTMYPHLRVIVTSATFDPSPIVEFFGDACAEPIIIEPVKTIGYYPPLYPGEKPHDLAAELAVGWSTPTFEPGDGTSWNLYDLTRRVERLRAPAPVSMMALQLDGKVASAALAQQLTRLCLGLDAEDIPGDIISFLPTRKTIDDAVAALRSEVDPLTTTVYDLMRDSPTETVAAVTAPHSPGSPRRVVVATNIAETSLTLDGFRFVVDTGLITSSEWLSALEATEFQVIPHSKSGIRQRWGRVGRTMPGWVFPLYSREDFDLLEEETPPGSLKDNLESVVLKAIAAGFTQFDPSEWPAAASGKEVDRERFAAEFARATARLRNSYRAVDADGDLTCIGQSAARSTRSVEKTLAIETADQMNCLPEVVVAIAFWGDPFGNQGVLSRVSTWPVQIRDEFDRRIDALLFGATDAVDFALTTFALWEQADPSCPPWEVTDRRRALAGRWWLNPEALEQVAIDLRRAINSMSSVTRAQKYRPVDLRLADRGRAAIAHHSEHFIVLDAAAATSSDGGTSFGVNSRFLPPSPGRHVSLSRAYREGVVELDGMVRIPEWALAASNVMELIEAAAVNGTVGAIVDAHAVRSHFPIGATLSLADGGISAEGFHRPLPSGRGPSDRDGNFLDAATRLLSRSGQLGDATAVEGDADEDVGLSPHAPPTPPVRVRRLADDDRPGVITAYAMNGSEVTLLVEPDYAPLRTSESLDGSDLVPGTTIDLVIGLTEGDQRKLIRADGRGWFLVRTNSNRPTFHALNRHDRDFLLSLKAGTPMRGTVVTDERHGNTISLLPDLLARVDALPAAIGKPRDGRLQRLLPARLLSDKPDENGYVRFALDGVDGLVSFSIKPEKLEESRIPLRVDRPFLVSLRPDTYEQRDRVTKRVKDYRVSRPVPERVDVSIIQSAGYHVLSDESGRRITNPEGVRPDPELWAAVATRYPSLGPLFGQFAVNSLAQSVGYRRTPRSGEVFDAPRGTWSPPLVPSWLEGGLPSLRPAVENEVSLSEIVVIDTTNLDDATECRPDEIIFADPASVDAPTPAAFEEATSGRQPASATGAESTAQAAIAALEQKLATERATTERTTGDVRSTEASASELIAVLRRRLARARRKVD